MQQPYGQPQQNYNYPQPPMPQPYQPIVGQMIQVGMNQVKNVIGQFGSGDPFSGIQTMKIEQQPEWIECFCPCMGEKKNSYQISSSDPQGRVSGMMLGKIDEWSTCPDRFFCQCWRALELRFIGNQNQVIFEAKREYKIPSVCCLPCERPKITVSVGSQVLGHVFQPWLCCGRSDCTVPILEELDILDPQGNMKYYISGEFMQCGCIARMCCLPRCNDCCHIINFDIYNAAHQKVGAIRNIWNSCCREYCSKADKFVIEFPQGATFEDKALFLIAVLTIDYDVFEYTFCNAP